MILKILRKKNIDFLKKLLFFYNDWECFEIIQISEIFKLEGLLKIKSIAFENTKFFLVKIAKLWKGLEVPKFINTNSKFTKNDLDKY